MYFRKKLSCMKDLIKRDKFYRARGATATILAIFCSRCKTSLCIYQKDGKGNLHRLYLDRIIKSESFFKIPAYNRSVILKGLPNIVCFCRNIIAVPMLYKEEGRLAFRLIHGSINKTKIQ